MRANRPPDDAGEAFAWPSQQNVYTQSYGQREAEELFGEDPRMWETDTVGFTEGDEGSVKAVRLCSVANPESISELPVDLVLVAKGFTGAQQALSPAS